MEANLKSETTASPRTKARKAAGRKSKTKPDHQVATKVKDKTPPEQTSKQGRVVAMLRRREGATIAAIMKVTGWQQHSVRGFFTGVVRKKLGFRFESEKKMGADRIYRIVEDKQRKPNRKANAGHGAA